MSIPGSTRLATSSPAATSAAAVQQHGSAVAAGTVAQHPAPAARRTDSYTLHEPSQFGASPPGQKPAQPLLPIGQAVAMRQVAAALEMAGLTRGGSVAKAAPAPLTGEMARLARTLNTESRRSKAYQDAIKAWPDSTPIWPHLENREARVNLVNHVVDTDKTNENAYGTFLNRCIGFATQLYARFSASAPAGKAELKDLETRLRYTPQDLADPKKRAEIDKPGNIQADQTPAKLRLPMFVAQNDTHAINAFLVDESRPNDVRSYMFYDPQNDGLLHAQHPDYKRHVQTWGIDICDARLNAAGQFDLTRKVTLLPTASREEEPGRVAGPGLRGGGEDRRNAGRLAAVRRLRAEGGAQEGRRHVRRLHPQAGAAMEGDGYRPARGGALHRRPLVPHQPHGPARDRHGRALSADPRTSGSEGQVLRRESCRP
jgi:hypothetical protein